MRQITQILLVLFFIQAGEVFSATYYSRMNGLWTNGLVWSTTNGGPACNCVPDVSDIIIINHNITMTHHMSNPTGGGNPKNGITGSLTINAGASLSGGNTYDLQIRAGGTLNLCGTLIVRDLQFFNGSTVNVCPTGSITVNGNFENNNNSNTVSINGSMTVAGSFQNGNGGSITGTGTVTITNGPVTNTGNLYGCSGTNPCASFPCNVISPCGVPLPVTWLSFNGILNQNAVLLNWVTGSEVNNNKFEIERSKNGEFFEYIGEISGSGTTNQLSKYQFIDKNPSRGINYYRLKQIDLDDAINYSNMIAVKVNSKSGLELYPNPWKNGSVALFMEQQKDQEYSVSIKNIYGVEIFNQKIVSESGKLEIQESNLQKFSPGSFVISVSGNGESLVSKFIIVK